MNIQQRSYPEGKKKKGYQTPLEKSNRMFCEYFDSVRRLSCFLFNCVCYLTSYWIPDVPGCPNLTSNTYKTKKKKN